MLCHMHVRWLPQPCGVLLCLWNMQTGGHDNEKRTVCFRRILNHHLGVRQRSHLVLQSPCASAAVGFFCLIA